MDDAGGVVRVLYFSQGYTPHDVRFLTSLGRTHHEVFYLRLESKSVLDTRPLPVGIQPLNWEGGRQPFQLVDIPRLALRLRRVFNELQPDVVHAGPVQKSAFLTALTGYQSLVTMSWGSDLLRDAQEGIGRWVARYTLARSAVLVCDCIAVRDMAIKLGFSAERVVIFPWGVDLDQFSPASGGELRAHLGWQSAFVLLSTRAWEPIYGIEVLISGFIQAAQDLPDLRLIMLGDGGLRAEIQRRLAQANLLDRVYFGGFIPYEQLPAYYRAADVYVSASRFDGSSVSLLEALATGRPVIVSDIQGNREWVDPGVNGWWFSDGEGNRLAQAIIESSMNQERLAILGKKGRRIAEERADWDRNFPQLLEAYVLAQASVRERN